MASGANEAVHYYPQSVFGAFPTAPFAWINLPRVSITTGSNMPGIVDPTIMADAQIHEVHLGVETSPVELATVLRYGAFDDLLAAVLRGAWDTNVLEPGILTPLIAIERHMADVTGKPYIRHRDCVFNKMSMSGKVDANIDVTWSVLSILPETAAAIITNTTYGTPPAYKAFATKTAVINLDSTPIGWASGWSLDIDNGCDYRKVTGAGNSLQQHYGAQSITGTIDGFYETAAQLDAFRTGATHALSWEFADEETNSLTIELPRVRFVDALSPASGGPGPTTQALKFQATYDPTEECSIRLTRAPYTPTP